jgi:hypothetical protein
MSDCRTTTTVPAGPLSVTRTFCSTAGGALVSAGAACTVTDGAAEPVAAKRTSRSKARAQSQSPSMPEANLTGKRAGRASTRPLPTVAKVTSGVDALPPGTACRTVTPLVISTFPRPAGFIPASVRPSPANGSGSGDGAAAFSLSAAASQSGAWSPAAQTSAPPPVT